MAITILNIGFSIYTLILIGVLIWFIIKNRETKQNQKRLKKEGILTQAQIINTWHPKKENSEATILDDRMTSAYDKETELIVEYEHEITNANLIKETFVGTIKVQLNFRNVETEKRHYEVGKLIDISYLKDNPKVADFPKNVRNSLADTLNLATIISALMSSIAILIMALFYDLNVEKNPIATSIGMLVGFLIYAFLLTGTVFIVLGTIVSIFEYIQLRYIKTKKIKEKGKVLNTWILSGNRGTASYHIKYTYPAIAPFSLEKAVNTNLYHQYSSEDELEIWYLESDKYVSDIIGNKIMPFDFFLFFVLAPGMLLFIIFIFYMFFVTPFL